MHPINIVRPFLPTIDEISDDFSECLATGLVTNNCRHVRAFEENVAAYMNARSSSVAFCNGEMALYFLLQAWKYRLGYGVGDRIEALVPSLTFSGTVNALLANNIAPVFCDVDDTLTLSVDKLEASKDVKMIVAVGVYGNLPDLEAILDFAKQHDLVAVFDHAPAFGSKFRGKFPAEYGVEEIYSFHATKVISAMEGGTAHSSDSEVTGYLKRLRDFGQFEKVRGDVDVPGLNGKMQEISAIVGNVNLRKANEIFQLRAPTIARYEVFFGNLAAAEYLKTMRIPEGSFCPYLYFPVILNEDAGAFVAHLDRCGVAVRRYYTATHKLKLYNGRFRLLNLDFTKAIMDSLVSFPLHTMMDDDEMDHIFKSVNVFFNR